LGDWLTSAMESWGYFGIFAAMFLENLFPPIPSEVVMPAAGYEASNGELSLWGVIIAGNLGSLVGVWLWYEVARWVGPKRLLTWISRHGVWIGITRGEADRSLKWFDNKGHFAVLVGRLVPGVRTLISLPAGFAEMRRTAFLLWSAIGTLGWTALLAWIGWSLPEMRGQAGNLISGIGAVVIVVLVVLWIARIVRHRMHHPGKAASG